jgi:hypothetical protein
MGSWSPDGAYLVFGLTEYFMDEVEHVTIDLRFLEAQTGKSASPSKPMDGQTIGRSARPFSLVAGRTLPLRDRRWARWWRSSPCADDVEDLASRYPVKFTHVMSSDEQGEHILLKNEEAYWLLDGISLEVRKIESVPTESYRPYVRLVTGRRASRAIPDERTGSRGRGVPVHRGLGEREVEERIPLEGASDANLPIVEWLTRDELLIHGNTLTVMDFRSEPPALTDVLRDIFLLDIAYPDDVWGMDTVTLDGWEKVTLSECRSIIQIIRMRTCIPLKRDRSRSFNTMSAR